MKVTEEHLEFVAKCIAEGEAVGDDAVRVDVLAIGERFGVTWGVARLILQTSARKLGHRMIGAKSTKVSRYPKIKKDRVRSADPRPRSERLADAAAALLEDMQER